ncbi:hypothetical protein LVJ94_12775 [Pendulispora rubella]|uniref:Lipoprotein n=1 Tax=Pendulispora rubella TaxID=2741070 RepID=A0ABZ2LB25_9BACT
MRRGALLLVCMALAGNAQAKPKGDPVKQQCIDDAEEGQRLRDEGKLGMAREKFVGCANPSCPGAVVKECRAWLTDVEARMPTLLISAVDAAGNDLVDVKVSVDGRPWLDRLTGTETAIDPGPHQFRLEAAGAEAVEETLVVAERQKGRALRAKFARVNAPAPPKKPEAASAPVAAYVVGGVGVAALASFAFFGLKGISDYNHLKDTCDPNCSTSDTDAVKTKFLVADISLGVGVVALGVATYLFLSHPGKSPSPSQATITPLRGGGWLAGYETRF